MHAVINTDDGIRVVDADEPPRARTPARPGSVTSSVDCARPGFHANLALGHVPAGDLAQVL